MELQRALPMFYSQTGVCRGCLEAAGPKSMEPNSSCWRCRLYAWVVWFKVAPVWARCMRPPQARGLITFQMIMAVRLVRGYHTDYVEADSPPPCRIAKSSPTNEPSLNSTATENHGTADKAPDGSHSDPESANMYSNWCITSQYWTRHNSVDKSPL